MDEVLRWLVGIAVTILLAVVTYMGNSIRELAKKHSEDTRGLHGRIDAVQRDYVRRDDFKEFKDELRDRFDKMDQKLDKIAVQTKPG